MVLQKNCKFVTVGMDHTRISVYNDNEAMITYNVGVPVTN